MNTKLRSILFLCFVLFTITSCKRKPEAPTDQTEQKTPVPVAHGTVIGTPTTKVIGVAGGTIKTTDGNIEIHIPAGAVSSETNFSIQEVTKTLTSATGAAYRLGPENVAFQKDVEITFKYTEQDIDGSAEDLLYLAYQNADGYWKRVILTDIDKANKSLKVKTRHFSDWSIERLFYVISLDKKISLSANEETKLRVDYDDISPNGELLPTLKFPQKNIDGWFVNGSGNVSPTDQQDVTYKAPAVISEPTTIVVGARIKNMVSKTHPDRPGTSGLVIVQKPIVLVPDEYLTWEVDGTKHTALAIDGALLGSLTTIIGTGLTGGVSLSLNETKPGKYPLGNIATAGFFNLQVFMSNQPDVIYDGTYYKCNDNKPQYGNGNLEITKYGNVGGYIEGHFNATVYYLKDCQHKTKRVSGSFKVKRKV